MKIRKTFISILLLALVTISCKLLQPSPPPIGEPTASLEPTLLPEPVLDVPAGDGEIAFASDRKGLWQILVINADGSNETSLTTSFGDYSYQAWSPDGQRIAMRMDMNSRNGIAVMDLHSTESGLAGAIPTPITDAFSDAPTWSPEGDEILFISSYSSGWEFYRYQLDGDTTVQLTGISPWARDPKWSPDGRALVVRLFHLPSKTSEVLLVSLKAENMVYLMETANNLRFGR